jgi:hypothetical protein
MEKRAFERIASDLTVKFYCCSEGCDGKAKDLSENGMFINTCENCFPVNYPFEIYIPSDGKLLKIPVTISRREILSGSMSGIGISFINAPKEH